MTAFKKLLLFSNRIAPELALEFIDLVQAYAAEEHQATIKLFEEIEAIKRPCEVVAIAGTAETLLADVPDTNVGDINVGDTVELINSNYNPPIEIRDLDLSFNKVYLVDDTYVDTEGTQFVTVEGNSNEILAKRFRKVQTPLSNPLNSVEGC
jgi:hypothetical protein